MSKTKERTSRKTQLAILKMKTVVSVDLTWAEAERLEDSLVLRFDKSHDRTWRLMAAYGQSDSEDPDEPHLHYVDATDRMPKKKMKYFVWGFLAGCLRGTPTSANQVLLPPSNKDASFGD